MGMITVNKPTEKQKVNKLELALKALDTAAGLVKTGADLQDQFGQPVDPLNKKVKA